MQRVWEEKGRVLSQRPPGTPWRRCYGCWAHTHSSSEAHHGLAVSNSRRFAFIPLRQELPVHGADLCLLLEKPWLYRFFWFVLFCFCFCIPVPISSFGIYGWVNWGRKLLTGISPDSDRDFYIRHPVIREIPQQTSLWGNREKGLALPMASKKL